jgi:glycosyltransferase involved in cell wall biosynthesis
MRKLIIQIPCLNEEKTLPATLADLPKEVPGFDVVETLVIDDGSTDNTVEVARRCGVNHILVLGKRCGLARAFLAGLTRCLQLGADVIVHTDADNQYNAADIPELVRPVVEGRADIVVGTRPISEISHFSPVKKFLQFLGSAVMRHFSQTPVADAPSGFRAYSKEAALRLNVFNRFTYTLETLIQAGRQGLRVVNVPVRVNPKTRESRLFKGIFNYVTRSLTTMIRIYVLYSPLEFFLLLAAPFFLAGIGFFGSWLYDFLFVTGEATQRIPALIAGAVCLLVSLQFFGLGVLADLLSKNRMLNEEIRYNQRRRMFLGEGN